MSKALQCANSTLQNFAHFISPTGPCPCALRTIRRVPRILPVFKALQPTGHKYYIHSGLVLSTCHMCLMTDFCDAILVCFIYRCNRFLQNLKAVNT